MQETSGHKRSVSILIITTYCLLRFVFINHIDALGKYASYLFEIIFSVVCVLLFKASGLIKIPSPFRLSIPQSILSVVLGFVVYKGIAILHLTLPFDLQSVELLLFIILIGPIIEEFIFRLAIWEAMRVASNSVIFAAIGTTALFSFGHLYAYWFVPAALQSFVIYQTTYVLVLSTLCSYSRIKNKTIIYPIALHVIFNLGFYFGFLI